jgi:predicted GIY-YIG superfamily endonuclease
VRWCPERSNAKRGARPCHSRSLAKNHLTPQFVYILHCSDSSYYVGITEDVSARLARHRAGKGCLYTRLHRPFTLVHQEGPYPIAQAMFRERQLKRWSKAKKEALIRRNRTGLTNRAPSNSFG